MKILFDEGMPKSLARHFPKGMEVSAVRQMGWDTKDNGELLQLAARESFRAMITLDRNMEHQQNLDTLPIAVIVLHSLEQDIDEYGELVATHVVDLLAGPIEKRVYSFGFD